MLIFDETDDRLYSSLHALETRYTPAERILLVEGTFVPLEGRPSPVAQVYTGFRGVCEIPHHRVSCKCEKLSWFDITFIYLFFNNLFFLHVEFFAFSE